MTSHLPFPCRRRRSRVAVRRSMATCLKTWRVWWQWPWGRWTPHPHNWWPADVSPPHGNCSNNNWRTYQLCRTPEERLEHRSWVDVGTTGMQRFMLYGVAAKFQKIKFWHHFKTYGKFNLYLIPNLGIPCCVWNAYRLELTYNLRIFNTIKLSLTNELRIRSVKNWKTMTFCYIW